ncbi:MAG: hypothetical protein REI45_01000, partial [Propionicimonas sp.]|nr:hypothetical protein [Propionicimonas sp.]
MAAQDITGALWPRWRLFVGLAAVATVGMLLFGGLVATMLALLVPSAPGTEQVDVDEQQRQRPAFVLRRAHQRLQPRLTGTPVGEAGQRIDFRRPPQVG